MRAMMWFTRDLRLDDQPALRMAAEAEELLCVFVVDPLGFRQAHWQSSSVGRHGWRFLRQSLDALDQRLRELGQRLHIAIGEPTTVVPELARQHAIDHVFVARQPGTEEYQQQEKVRLDLAGSAQLHVIETLSVFREGILPFELSQLPETFSRFRKTVERHELTHLEPLEPPRSLPPAPGLDSDEREALPPVDLTACPHFSGGEVPARERLDYYLFESHCIATYKQTRNALDEPDASSRLSPWLANGSLSVRRTAQEIARYQDAHGRNESTYWLWFELLWREYFYWYALAHHERLFARSGVTRGQSHTRCDPDRYEAWTQGRTDWPLVNAAMNQLRRTGWISNRARQIVASCFVNELELDWRYGAAWFQEQLVDHDVASNWGNWQYLAGVGADPQQKRWFNLEKQQQQFDPQGIFVARWAGDH